MSGMWPHANALANRIKAYIDDTDSMEAPALKSKYYTTGRQIRAPRFSKNFSTANIETAGVKRKSPSRSPSPHKKSQASLKQKEPPEP